MGHKLPGDVSAFLSLILVHSYVIIADRTAISRHLQLRIDLAHDHLEPGEEFHIQKLFLELLQHISSKLFLLLWNDFLAVFKLIDNLKTAIFHRVGPSVGPASRRVISIAIGALGPDSTFLFFIGMNHAAPSLASELLCFFLGFQLLFLDKSVCVLDEHRGLPTVFLGLLFEKVSHVIDFDSSVPSFKPVQLLELVTWIVPSTVVDNIKW
eukprot:CAMPEP_0185596790 /NCGR_PEP_ID=MMETSP0434-20130131/80961_1 /TAXON_ID=626734 ORGANISM="Favella taraikaensis, Strain Fe Narragansett Bay" /NCGR_SAMPLE_ID=MMETSP0434 /ASSEMBLY_ACC=CAM_ASM_000379 /LENGTH=209 /DNA_ID=CAMNT_0028225349 /DNA_START=1937 /DNA_END=2563 /DNA_ORIENTATION=+